MEVDILNTLVTAAIWRAEQLDSIGLQSVSAWMEVSKLEEEIAKSVSVREPEGRIARRGAIRAALKAEDQVRAQILFESYLADDETPKSLRKALHEVFEGYEEQLSEEFPLAAKHNRLKNIRNTANMLVAGGPFGLAA